MKTEGGKLLSTSAFSLSWVTRSPVSFWRGKPSKLQAKGNSTAGQRFFHKEEETAVLKSLFCSSDSVMPVPRVTLSVITFSMASSC